MIPSNLQSLPNRFFQPALSNKVAEHPSGFKTDKLAVLVVDVEDINQCIYVIIQTPKGADPHRPTFGCDAWKWTDAPINVARPNLVREITDSLRQWEPRIELVQITANAASTTDNAHMQVKIEWRLTDEASDEVFVTNLSIGDLSL